MVDGSFYHYYNFFHEPLKCYRLNLDNQTLYENQTLRQFYLNHLYKCLFNILPEF